MQRERERKRERERGGVHVFRMGVCVRVCVCVCVVYVCALHNNYFITHPLTSCCQFYSSSHLVKWLLFFIFESIMGSINKPWIISFEIDSNRHMLISNVILLFFNVSFLISLILTEVMLVLLILQMRIASNNVGRPTYLVISNLPSSIDSGC